MALIKKVKNPASLGNYDIRSRLEVRNEDEGEAEGQKGQNALKAYVRSTLSRD